jgi:hypothetical protein
MLLNRKVNDLEKPIGWSCCCNKLTANKESMIAAEKLQQHCSRINQRMESKCLQLVKATVASMLKEQSHLLQQAVNDAQHGVDAARQNLTNIRAALAGLQAKIPQDQANINQANQAVGAHPKLDQPSQSKLDNFEQQQEHS